MVDDLKQICRTQYHIIILLLINCISTVYYLCSINNRLATLSNWMLSINDSIHDGEEFVQRINEVFQRLNTVLQEFVLLFQQS